MKNLILSGLLSSLFLGGCAYKAQVIRLDPKPAALVLATSADTIPSGSEVVLRAHDARPNKEIGRRSEGSRGEASITTDQDLAGLLKSKTRTILHSWGFRADSTVVSGTRSLDIELQDLSYKMVTTEDSKRKVKIRALLVASAVNGRASLKRTFDASQERQVIFEPVARSNEEWINETFTQLLQELATDPRLEFPKVRGTR